MISHKLIVALDFPEAESALSFVDRLSPQLCKLKVGMELYTAAGPVLVDALVKRGFDVFLDLKFHDIPTTVARACKAAANLGVWMMNVHALGGGAMMAGARESLGHAGDRPLLVAVTVLTSMNETDVKEIGLLEKPRVAALRFAGLALRHGVDGVVCSAHEANAVLHQCGEQFLRVTPGIRLQGADNDDQKRVMTPSLAVRSGASYLVIGRPITKANDPQAVLQAIETELKVSGESK